MTHRYFKLQADWAFVNVTMSVPNIGCALCVAFWKVLPFGDYFLSRKADKWSIECVWHAKVWLIGILFC